MGSAPSCVVTDATDAVSRCRLRSAAAAATSSAAEAPFSATMVPCSRSNGAHQPRRRGERGHRPARHGVVAVAVAERVVVTGGDGAPAHHDDPVAQAQFVDDLGEEGRPAQQRFEQAHVEVRAGQRQRDARQAGAAADVHDVRRRRDGLADGDAVEHVAIPDAVHLAGPHQAPLDALGRQQPRVDVRAAGLVPEHGRRGRMGRGVRCVGP